MSSNVTDLTIPPGAALVVDINVTNAPPFNGFELALFFDPNVLTAESIDDTSGTVFGGAPQGTFRIKDDRDTPGVIRLAIIALNFQFEGGFGTLVHINFRVNSVGVSPLVLAAGTSMPSTFSQSPDAKTPNHTMLVLGSVPIDVSTTDGHFRNSSNFGPVATFFFTPSLPEAGDRVAFNATYSYDPDAPPEGPPIVEYVWEFGDRSQQPVVTDFDSFIERPFQSVAGGGSVGNFSVRLTVRDQQGAVGMKTMLVEIVPKPVHDIALESLSASPTRGPQGTQVTLTMLIRNEGTFDEEFFLLVTYRSPLTTLRNFTGETILSKGTRTLSVNFDTSGLTPGAYEIGANATITTPDPDAIDAEPGDNSRKTIISVTQVGSSPLLLIVGGAVVLAGAGTGAGLLLKRRRAQRDSR